MNPTFQTRAYWMTLRDLARFQMRARYRGTIAGFLWVVIHPLALLAIQGMVFRHILRAGVPSYPAFLLGGLLPWIFFSTSIQMGVPALAFSRDLLLAFRLHPSIPVFSIIVDNWLNFLSAFFIATLFLLAFGSFPPVGMALLAFPFAALLLLAGVTFITFPMALLNVFFRDLRFISHFILNIMLFLTPVFYPTSLIPEQWRWVVAWNPMTLLIEPIRSSITAAPATDLLSQFSSALLLVLGLGALALFYWRRCKNELYSHL
jgi:lipopolysaccharide transport system permease protein